MFYQSLKFTQKLLLLSAASLISACASPAIKTQDTTGAITHPEASISQKSIDQKPMTVIADVHGDYQSLIKLLQKSQIIDPQLKWVGGQRYLVSLGDLLDRGPDSRKVLDLFMRLEQEARQAGGALKMVMGNHESMNIRGDLRYVSKAEFTAFASEELASTRNKVYQDFLSYSQLKDNQESKSKFEALYPAGFFGLVDAYSPQGKYGKWLLQKGFILTLQNKLFAHGGFSKKLIETGLNEQQLNQQFRQDLTEYSNLWRELIDDGLFKYYFDKRERIAVIKSLLDGQIKNKKLNKHSIHKKAKRFLQVADSLLFDSYGPIWYRGNVLCHAYSEEETIEQILTHFNVEQILLGHTPDSSRLVRSRFDERLIMLDTGMLQSHYQGHPSAVIFENNQMRVLNIDNSNDTTTHPDPVRKPLYANGIEDSQLLNFYQHAKVIAEQPLNDFFSKPIRLTLEHEGKQHKAIFKYFDSDPKLEDSRWKRADNFADRYLHDIVAYKLDRLLGLYMVPFTMPYHYQGKKGIIQYWIEGSINKSELIRQKRKLKGFCPADEAKNLMQFFDWLIDNEDRNTGNELYTEDDGFLWLIDHSRAFRVNNQLPEQTKKSANYLSPQFKQKLAALNKEDLKEELGQYLNRKQINSLLKRRDLILMRF